MSLLPGGPSWASDASDKNPDVGVDFGWTPNPSGSNDTIPATDNGLPIIDENVSDPGKTQGQITRAQWDYVKDFFVPIEDELIGKITADVEPEADRAGDIARTGFDLSQASVNRDIARQGGGITARQRVAINRGMDLGRAKTHATAENSTRRGLRERNINLIAQMAGIGRGIQQNALGGMSSAANLKAERDATYKAAKQSHKQNMVSAGVTLGAALIGLI